jgi:hypothetical protein
MENTSGVGGDFRLGKNFIKNTHVDIAPVIEAKNICLTTLSVSSPNEFPEKNEVDMANRTGADSSKYTAT